MKTKLDELLEQMDRDPWHLKLLRWINLQQWIVRSNVTWYLGRREGSLICRWFGHRWRYNFPSIPNRRICKCCHSTQTLDGMSLSWEDSTFPHYLRVDKKATASRWFK